MRSARASGPCGCAAPRTSPSSMSAAVANPDSSILIAESTNGISNALTTKPARSWQSMACLPRVFSTKVRARSVVSPAVSRLGTSSTSESTGTGLKKCTPRTWLGREVATASFMIGIEEVFEASTAWGEVTIWSSRLKRATLALSSSRIASTTSSRSASSPRPSTTRIRLSTSVALSILPRSSARISDFSSRFRPVTAAACDDSATTTSRPALAQTSAIPAPIRPQPTTPILFISSPVSALDAEGLAGPLRVPKGKLLDLSGRRLRQLDKEVDVAWRLVVGDLDANVVDQLALGDLMAVLEYDERLGPLAPLLVGHPDHCHLQD